MLEINLLPWREKATQANKQLIQTASIVFGIVGIILTVIAHFIYATSLNDQRGAITVLRSHINQIKAENAKLEGSTKTKPELVKRVTLLQELQYMRYENAHFINTLTDLIPNGIHLDKLERDGNIIKLSGTALSNIHISDLINDLDESHTVATPTLDEIKTVDKDGVTQIKFTLNVALQKPQLLTIIGS